MRVLIALVVTLVASVACADDVSFPVVVDGKPVVRVVCAEQGKYVQGAVEDFKTYVKHITGAELEVVQGKDDLPGPTLHIGKTSYYADVAETLSEIELDGYALVRVGEDILLAGKMPQGTANGITTILQDQFNVRWYYADPLFETWPEQESLAIKFAPTHGNNIFIENPALIERTLWGNSGPATFARRMRMTASGTPLPYVGAGHSLSNVVPTDVYAKEHPDYFCMIDGKRVLDGSPHPCFTHPDMFDVFMKYVREGGYSFGVNDNLSACQCERCKAVDGKAPKYLGMVNFSESYCQLMKRVAAQTAKEFPDRRLGIFAYQQTSSPPQTVDHIGDNVDLVLCQDTSQHFDPAVQKMDHDFSRQWVDKVGHVRFYGYVGINYWVPRYFPTLLAQQIQHLAKLGVKGWGTHSITMTDSSMPMFYMMYQLMWDPDQDHAAMIDAMLTDLYGEAAGPMKSFYQHWEDCWMRQKKGRWFKGMDDFRGEMTLYPEQDIALGRTLLNEAAALAKNERVAKRVAWISDRYAWTEKTSRVHYFSMRAITSKPETEQDAVVLSDAVVNAWKDLGAYFPKAEKLSGITPSSWHGKTFRVRMWALKQQVRDAVSAPYIQWLVRNETHRTPPDIDMIERMFHRVALAGMREVEPLAVKQVDAQIRPERTDGVRAPMIPKTAIALPLDVNDPAWQAVPKIDAIPWVFRDGPDYATVGKYEEPRPENIVNAPDAEDQSMTWQAAYDDKHLYLRIEVTDNKHEQSQSPSGMTKEDSIQVALNPRRDDMLYDVASWTYLWGGYKGYEAEFSLAHLNDAPAINVPYHPKSIDKPEEFIQTNTARSDNKTIYVAAVSWELIPDFDPVFRRSLGISLVVNDADNGTRRMAEYGSGVIGVEPSRRTTKFAAIRLGQ